MASPAESEYREVLYCWQSSSIRGVSLYTAGELAFVQFETHHWPGYDGYSNYVTAAIFPEHLRPADPQSPGVMNFVQALDSEAAAQQQHLSNCGHRANGQRVSDMGIHISKSKQDNGQGARAPKPAKPPGRQRKARASGGTFTL